jgi:integrase/recombinase XerD
MNAERVHGQVIGFVKDTIAEEIQDFLNEPSLSVNTRASYKVAITDFFDYFQFLYKGKNITTLTEEDIVITENKNGSTLTKLIFTNNHIKKYRKHLVEKGLANGSINYKMSAIRSLFDSLAKDRPYFNTGVFKLKPLDDVSDSYDDFTTEEVEMMFEKAKEYPNGLQKYLLLKLAAVTSFRVSSLLNLTWKHIKKHNEDVYVVYAKDEAIGKGQKKDEKSINKTFYEELLQLKGKYDDGKIFHMHRKSAWDLIKQLVDDLNLNPDGDKKLTFHSLKRWGGNEILDRTNDLRLTKIQMAHSSETTFLKNYNKKMKDPAQSPSLLLLEEVDMDLLKKASLDQILQAIDGCNSGVKLQIAKKLKEIIG